VKIPKLKAGKRVPADPCLALFFSYCFSKLCLSEKGTSVSDSIIGIVIFSYISAGDPKFDYHSGQKGDFILYSLVWERNYTKKKEDLLK